MPEASSSDPCEDCGEAPAYANGLCPACIDKMNAPDVGLGNLTKRFYVTVTDGPRYVLALGPFDTHGEALDRVSTVEDYVRERDVRSPWYAFGTGSVEAEEHDCGKLNAELTEAR